MTNEVISFKPKTRKSAPSSAPKQQSKAQRYKLCRQRVVAGVIACVALVITVLSLSHLAAGVEVLTHDTPWHAKIMAVGFDLGFICMELAKLSISNEKLDRAVSRYADPAIIGTLVISAGMNAYAFASKADNVYFVCAGCLFGIGVPAMIYVLTRISALMWIDAQR